MGTLVATFCLVDNNMVNVIFYLSLVPLVNNSIIPKTFRSKKDQQDEEGSRKERQVFINGPIGPTGPINRPLNRINPFFALPAIIGVGASLAWLALQRVPITTNISGIGSPSTNVTTSFTNSNTQNTNQAQTVNNAATNTNNDADTITQNNPVTVTNTNSNPNCVCNCVNNVCTCNCGKK